MLQLIKNKVRALCVRLANSILTDESTQAIVLNIGHKKLQDKVSHHIITQIFHQLLEDESVRQEIWKNANIRPDTNECSYALSPNNIRDKIFEMATKTTAEYVIQNMSHLHGVFKPLDLISFALKQANVKGLFLEFGVFSGTTINHIASETENTVHGFDSFEGLPEQWGNVAAGTFSTKGVVPETRDNVRLHIGWFNESLPKFVEKHKEKVSFLHIDSDIYSSAKTILSCLSNQIIKGTIIVFDEYFNYPGWENHEYKAFQEFVKDNNKQYEYIAYSSKGFSVAVVVK